MKSRAFVRDVLKPAGAVLERKDGDHHIYRLPSGRTLIVPMGGSQSGERRHGSGATSELAREAADEALRELGVRLP